ncbi:MAG: M23 family metallopeptidase [Rectinemataceae bacterium]|jgi:murein DD-endopeptidase MepM/ murein hydrolase activator NlpD
MNLSSRALCLVLFASLRAAIGVAQSTTAQAYPPLGSLGPDDLIYTQQQEQLAQSYAAIQSGKRPPDLVIYSYVVRAPVDLFSLAARLNLPYETLATMNRLDRSRSFLPGELVLAPSAPGVFAPLAPGSDLDLLLSYRGKDSGNIVSINAGGKAVSLRFYPGARFSPEERALFLGLLFRFPLPSGILTSGFGPRESPITHHMVYHSGIDLAAPMGTEVYAARDGRVTDAGVNAVLGQYIVITHDGSWSTVYGHLSARRVRLNDRVESGMIIGNVGSTGESTGPHLHFEVRSRGEPRDPEPLIPQGKK